MVSTIGWRQNILPETQVNLENRDWDALLQYHEKVCSRPSFWAPCFADSSLSKSETFDRPTGNNLNVTPAYELSVHGKSGPIQASFGPYISPQFNGLFGGLRSLDVPEMKDPNGGDNVGVGWITSSIDPKTRIRSYSTTGYRKPSSYVAKVPSPLISLSQLSRTSGGRISS